MCFDYLFSICKPEHARPNNDNDYAIDDPLRITGHKTAWQNINALKKPNAACQYKKY